MSTARKDATTRHGDPMLCGHAEPDRGPEWDTWAAVHPWRSSGALRRVCLAAARASQPAQEPAEAPDTTQDAGAEAGLSGLPAVPDEATKAVAEALYRAYDSEFCADHLSWKDFTGQARELIVIAIPAIEQRARAQVADEIEAEEAKIDRWSGEQARWHSNGMIAAANLVRGEGR
jgi:hypothetical protein